MRPADWQRRLFQHIEGMRWRSFQYGVHDCVTFTCGCVAVMTAGRDPAQGLRGTYHDLAGAERLIYEAGGLVNWVRRTFGEPKPAAKAQLGDLVLWRGNLGPTLGVCLGTRSAFTAEDGLVFLPTSWASAAWEVR